MPNHREKSSDEESKRQAREREQRDEQRKPGWDKVLEADEESFPASDAPAWTSSAEGRPHYEPPQDAESAEKPRDEPPR